MTRPRAPAEPVHDADPGAWRRLAPRRHTEAARGLRGLCRRAGGLLPHWDLIRAEDCVLAALSGGKDSFAMLEVLLELRARAPVEFTVGAIVVDPGFAGFDAPAVAAFAGKRGVATWIVRADIQPTLEQLGWRQAPCALCARLRRGVLYRVAPALGFNRLALGHHADDAIETALMNMFFNGQLRGMAPRYQPSEPQAPAVIRPLLASFEADVAAYARQRGFTLVDSACPLCQVPETERLAIKHWIIELSAEHPRLRQSLLASLGNVSAAALMDPVLRGGSADAPDGEGSEETS